MRSLVAESFRKDLAKLPENIQTRARHAYGRFATDPFDPTLSFKRLNTKEPWWSVRISGGYRAVGSRVDKDTIVWFFIGSHADYDRLLSPR